MAHTIGTIPARASGTGNPTTFSQAVLAGETVFCLMIKAVGAVDRAGGAPTWGPSAFTQAGTTQKAATTPEASCELWYLLNPPPGTRTVTIPNTGGLTLFWQMAMGKAKLGGQSRFDGTAGTNGTSTNPSPGALVTTADGDILFAIVAGGHQTFTSATAAFTSISIDDDGSDGGATQYQLQATRGSTTMSWTHGTSEDWGAVTAAFLEVAPVAWNNFLAVRAGTGISVGERIR